MYQHRHNLILIAVLLVSLLATGVSAQSLTVDPTDRFCFSADDFSGTAEQDGIFLTSLPRPSVATLRQGSRVLQPGDALPVSALDSLTLTANCISEQEVSIGYYTVSNGAVSGKKELKLSILPRKNQAPTAEDGALETYRNIPNSGTLSVNDPEGGTLTYTVVNQPKRGTVELHEDGTFTYTPNENKVGKDSFTFTATDEAGNVSQLAKISVYIKKPTEKTVYADMQGDPDAYAAAWLREAGLFTGNEIAGNLCFEPEKAVSRGEFLVMAMKLVEANVEETAMTSGFGDEAQTPGWMQPYIVSALADGMITGTRSEDGVLFRPQAELTRAEATVILQNILQLPAAEAQPAAAMDTDTSLPVWAEQAVCALSAAGIHLDMTTGQEVMTRRDTARLLCDVSELLQSESAPTFYWVQ